MHSVVNNSKYFNESYAQINGCYGRDVKGELNPMYGRTHTLKNKEIFSKASKNMMMARHKISNKILRVSTDEWKLNPLLEAESKGRKINDTSKYAHKGKSNNAAIRINIYDNNNNLRYECHGDFSEVCVANNLPSSALATTYKNNTIIYYGKYAINKAIKLGHNKFKGRYARKI